LEELAMRYEHLAWAICGAAAAYAQESPEYKITTDVEMVLLDVAVADVKGRPVAGLEPGNFTVFENGIKRPIRTFAAMDQPVTAGLLIDQSGSMRPRIQEAQLAALSLASASNPADEFFTIVFNETVAYGLREGTGFTDDPDQLRSALAAGVPRGRTALYDAVAEGLQHLPNGRHARKALIVISDGGDNASRRTRAEVLRMAQSSLATVYAVAIYDPDDRDRDPGFLRRLAAITGGEAFFPGTIKELPGISARIAAALRNRYAIGITPFDTRLDGTVRRLRVEAVDAEGRRLAVRARTQYIAEPLRP
jgi:Ca-activated chloride channel family protein